MVQRHLWVKVLVSWQEPRESADYWLVVLFTTKVIVKKTEIVLLSVILKSMTIINLLLPYSCANLKVFHVSKWEVYLKQLLIYELWWCLRIKYFIVELQSKLAAFYMKFQFNLKELTDYAYSLSLGIWQTFS